MPSIHDHYNKNIDRLNRLVLVSNRLPVTITKTSKSKWQVTHSSGGLVTALAPIPRDHGGIWIGWPSSFEKHFPDTVLTTASRDKGFTIKPIILSEEEIAQYYRGFCNETIWPLFHDLPSRCTFNPRWWQTYLTALPVDAL